MLTQQLNTPGTRRNRCCLRGQMAPTISLPSALRTEGTTTASLRINMDRSTLHQSSSMSCVSTKHLHMRHMVCTFKKVVSEWVYIFLMYWLLRWINMLRELQLVIYNLAFNLLFYTSFKYVVLLWIFKLYLKIKYKMCSRFLLQMFQSFPLCQWAPLVK